MVKKTYAVVVCLAAALYCLPAIQADDKPEEAKAEKKKVELLCPVSGKAADKEHAVDYKGAKVYFCCPNCPKAFKDDPAKFAAKANFQLVASGQFKQAKCPIAGKKVNTEKNIEINGLKVCFCCGGCQGKATKAEGDAKLELVFNDKAFEKGFVKKDKKEKSKKKFPRSRD